MNKVKTINLNHRLTANRHSKNKIKKVLYKREKLRLKLREEINL
jgi:hypothetical protein